MDRTACVDVPALPLQLLLRRHPEWTSRAMAVVDEDRPQGVVLSLNAAAREGGVRTGMRYGAALALAPGLCAGAVPPGEVAAGVAAVAERLLRFTPGVEPSRDEPGVFHLDASGLTRLHGSLAEWAGAVVRDLAAAGFRARVAAGFTRFGVYAAARTARSPVVFATQDDESRAARAAPLGRLGVAPALRDALAKLGVHTVGDLLRLPEDGLRRRFGEEAALLHRAASGGRGAPLERVAPAEPLEESVAFEHPVDDATQLVFLAKRLLDPVLARAAARGDALTEVTLRLVLDRHAPREERLRPAAPTLDPTQILDLLHLRIGALRLPSGVVEATLSAQGTPASQEQLRLFIERPRRDPAAAQRAFARLAAEFGADAVVVARLTDGHLPETRFAWEPATRLAPPRPTPAPDPTLVLRAFAHPVPLPRPPENGDVVRRSGPYLFAGGWWTGGQTRRAYHFAETRCGGVLWVFLDARKRAWFLQGRVE